MVWHISTVIGPQVFYWTFLIIKQDHLHDHRVRGQLVSTDWVTSTTVYDYYHMQEQAAAMERTISISPYSA